MTKEPVAFADLPAYYYPFYMRAFNEQTNELLWEEYIQSPAVVKVPGYGDQGITVRIENEYATGHTVIADSQGNSTVRLKCKCCGFEQTYEDTLDAYKEGWDEPHHMGPWPVTCPLCPGVASLGLVDHSEAHKKWEKKGRPDHFTGEGIKDKTPEEVEKIKKELGWT